MDVREKLVELLDAVQHSGYTYTPSQVDDRYGYRKDIPNTKVASHLIANGVTVQGWISVKDRLPEVGSIVLVSDNEADCHVWQYTNYSERGVAMPWMDEFGIPCKTEEITHWMPLPQPPKGE